MIWDVGISIGISIGIIIIRAPGLAMSFALPFWTSAWRGFQWPLTVIGSNLENK
jgi:hypothetical protein